MTPEHMLKPKATLDVIATSMKSEEHFCAHRDDLVSNLQQQPDEGIHVLSQHICELITKSKFTHAPTTEMLKIMVLQHTVKYHEAMNWIRQDQSQLMYQALLSHCKMLKVQCEQYQKAKERGHADLVSITAATSSLHLDAISSSKYCCKKCGYSHPNSKCPAKGQQCYVCGGYNHYTALCKQKGCCQNNKQWRGFKPNCNPSCGCLSCHSPWRHHHRSQSSHIHSRTLSHSPSHSPTCGTSSRCSSHSKRHSTPHRYYQDALEVIPANSMTTGSWAEGKLFTESTSNRQVAFYTCLHLPARSGTNTMTIKIDPGTQVNTIPLSKYCNLYPNKLTKSRYPKAKTQMPTHHTWISHDGSQKPFLGHFIVEAAHAKEPRMYPVRFYVFEDTMSPHILISYATSERLGIVSFQVPNLAATHKTDQVVIPNPQWQEEGCQKSDLPGPLKQDRGVPHTHSNNPASCCSKRKTASLKGEEMPLTASLSRTISDHQEVKVGKINHFKTMLNAINHFKTLKSPQVPNSPLPRPLGTPLWQMPPFLAFPSQFSATQRCSHPQWPPHTVARSGTLWC